MPPPPDDEDEEARIRASLLALLAVILLVVGGVWVMVKYKESSAELDCFLSGRKNCATIDVPSGQ